MKAAGISTGGRPTQESIDSNERSAWLALAQVPGLGARRLTDLIHQFGTATAAIAAPVAQLESLPGFTTRAARRLQRVNLADGHKRIEEAANAGQMLLIPSDPEYPPLLRSIPDPPPYLYVVGDAELLTRPAVAIIGSRNHSQYGRRVAERLGEVVAGAGAVVVSGMARGLDAIAQGAALNAGGRSVGVLGTGADVVYPVQNQRLFDRMLKHGALVTESPPGARPSKGAFPRRNRIISGLSVGLVVVEAAERSGTLITVNCALEQGRDVYAIPGPIDGSVSKGTNRLIRDGAVPVLDANDLPVMLGLRDPGATRSTVRPPCTLSPDEALVFGKLNNEPLHLDGLAVATGLPVGTLLGVLLGLELGGLTEQLPGGVHAVKLKARC